MIWNKRLFIILLSVLFLSFFTSCNLSGNNAKDNIRDAVSLESTETDLIEDTAVLMPEQTETDLPEEEESLLDIFLTETSVERGNFLILKAVNAKEEFSYRDFFGRKHQFISGTDAYYSLLPIAVYDKPGNYVLTINAEKKEFNFDIQILDKEFEIQDLNVSNDIIRQTLENKEAKSEYARETVPFLFRKAESRKWEGKFNNPLKSKYKISTSFGTFRTFSNGFTEYHEAIDMAAVGGTPVYSPNNGKVVYAGFLEYTGNTVIIDHGMGVLSWYFHLRSYNVNAGDEVEKDQNIARVGTTGLSTGNHLHFGISIDGIFVNPDLFIEKEINLNLQEGQK